MTTDFEFVTDRARLHKSKFSRADIGSENVKLAARGELKVKKAIAAIGLDAQPGRHNDPFDLIATTAAGDVKIEVKTARYSRGMYKFHIRKSTADFIVLACLDRVWWYLVIPGADLAGVTGFSIRARKPDQYRGKFKDSIGKFDLISQRSQ